MTPPRLRPRNRAEWLLTIPIVVPLLIPLYNRVDPTLWGVPFFYWFQIACAALAIGVISLVHRLGKERR
ncbi:hypothetical protein HDA40_001496 [Hamadaea flava]|uniref:DUF3311 domain-containing protein n=1 Tax=Hamadaea flava TaxID=1742688 RepID=A0ABV8LQ10_9ACTN|nr:DUF3311 domain-containing protein [Hamadaea flava]MCP2322989.1 hypothetical protein [Hamadaea flava]